MSRVCFDLPDPFLVNLGIAHSGLGYQIISLETELGVGVEDFRDLIGIIKKQIPS